MIALLLAFIAYQIYRLVLVHVSVALIALSVFDVIVVWLTWREYGEQRARVRASRVAS